MTSNKRMWTILIILLALGLAAGCEELSDGSGNTTYSYEVDVLYPEIFNSSSHTMTMDEWFYKIKLTRWWFQWDSFTAFKNDGKALYKDAKLKKAFAASDVINDKTVIYSDFDFYGRGEKIGTLSGTITLTDIFDPPPKVWLQSGYFLTGKVNMSKAAGTSATLDWLVPVYETYFQPDSQAQFNLSVLPNGSNYTLSVDVPTPINVGNGNKNAGSLGTVSIKGVTLSGTINVTYNGQPVPYVEIWANHEVATTLQDTCLFSPGADAPWTIILNPSNTNRDITFQVLGFTKQNWTVDDMLFDRYAEGVTVDVSNQDVPEIVLNLWDIEG